MTCSHNNIKLRPRIRKRSESSTDERGSGGSKANWLFLFLNKTSSEVRILLLVEPSEHQRRNSSPVLLLDSQLCWQKVVLQEAGEGFRFGTNILRGRMREVSLLPSSLRLDLLLSATGFSFGSSSDWPSVLSQAVLLVHTVQFRHENGCTAAVGARAHTHTHSSCICSKHLPYIQMF